MKHWFSRLATVAVAAMTLMAMIGMIAMTTLLSGCDDDEPASVSAPPSNQPVTTDNPALPTTDDPAASDPDAALAPGEISMAPPPVVAPTKPTDVAPSTAPATAPEPPAQLPPMSLPQDDEAVETDPTVATFAGLRAPKPAAWRWQPPSRQFSVAEYIVPGVSGADQARINVFQVGGTLEANIERWKSQFRDENGDPVEPKIETFTADDMNVTLVEFLGEYRGMAGGAFTPNQLFLTAVVETAEGNVFIRFVGPEVTVENNREAFYDMIHNLERIEAVK